jgi:uncharacterized protein (TIGR02452 family)
MGQIEQAIAQDTLQIIKQGYYINKQNEQVAIDEPLQTAIANTRLYTPEDLEQLPSRNKRNAMATIFEATHETSIEAIQRLSLKRHKVMCLNFASAKNPGGGFENGAAAQEESLARSSGLYPCLLHAPAYYQYHKKQSTCLYSDHMIYSPNVPFFKNDAGELTENPYLASILTSAAVNAGVVRTQEPDNIHKIESEMRIRIRKMLTLCAVQGYEHLVLGAWGCGVFDNDPEMIAELFREKLTDHFAGCFRHIVFAIKTEDERIFQPFNTRFNGTMYYLMY